MSPSETLSVNCPHCLEQYKVPASAIGKNVSCKKCKNKFLIEKIPEVAAAAIDLKFLTKSQLKYAQKLQFEDKQNGTDTTLAELFVKTGMLKPSQMKEVHKKIKLSKKKETINQKGKIDLKISDDCLTAELFIKGDFPKDFTLESIEQIIKENNIVSGIQKKYLLTAFINNQKPDSSIIIAQGRKPIPGKNAEINYHFNTNFYRNKNIIPWYKGEKINEKIETIKEGDLLAEKLPAVNPAPGLDIYGKSIDLPKPDDIELKCSFGAEIFENNTKIFASTSGKPLLSLDNHVSVYKEKKLNIDFGLKSGKLPEDCSYHFTKTITGEFPLKGGAIEAEEIRGGHIDAKGYVKSRIGIYDSVIFSEGDVEAKHIHNSKIYTFGSVFVENEILDCTIHACGCCISKTSKIVASKINAGFGISSKGIGSDKSEPCIICTGNYGRSFYEISKIEASTKKTKAKICQLSDEKKEFQKKIFELEVILRKIVSEHGQIKQELDSVEKKIKFLEEKKSVKLLAKEKKTSEGLKKKLSALIRNLQSNNTDKLSLQKDVERINLITENLKQELLFLEEKKNILNLWNKKNNTITFIHTDGIVASGTVFKGNRSELTIKPKMENIKAEEQEVEQEGTGSQWIIKISSN